MAKTQAEINKRLDAYAKGTVDSPYRVKKATSYDPSFGVMEAGAIDADGYYHAQCQDLITDYVLWLTDNKVRTWGNAKDQIKQSYGTGFKIHENKPSTVPKKGWIAVFTSGSYEQWGHIGIVYDGGNTSTFTILEQNWNGYANKKPTKRVDNYYGLTHFIEIPVKAGTTVKKETAKKSASTPATRPVTGSWKKNQYGTWYKPENATFVNGNQPIVTRIGSPFLNAPVGGNLPAGATIVYDEVCIQAGHIWIGYNAYNGNRVYCPVRTCQGVPPNQIPGVAWGVFK